MYVTSCTNEKFEFESLSNVEVVSLFKSLAKKCISAIVNF